MIFAQLFLMLVVILIAAEVFTNALEHLGEKLKISEGVTGSLFAAIGTALPETMVPLLAHFRRHHQCPRQRGNRRRRDSRRAADALHPVDVPDGRLAVLKKRGLQGHLTPEHTGLTRDLNFFLAAFSLSAIALFVPHEHAAVPRAMLAFGLVLIYFVYIMLTLRASAHLVKDGHGTEAEGKMLLCRSACRKTCCMILIQLGAGPGACWWPAQKASSTAWTRPPGCSASRPCCCRC